MAICTIEGCKCKTGAIAVVFVPGIMGSRLKNKASGDVVWDPGVGAGIHLSTPMRELKQQNKQVLEDAKEAFKSEKANFLKKGTAGLGVGAMYLHKYSTMPAITATVETVMQIGRKSRLVYDLANFWLSNAAERKQLLVNPEKQGAYDRKDDLLKVDQGDISYFTWHTKIPPGLAGDYKNRGWGTVSWESYGNFLLFIEREVTPEILRKCRGYQVKTYAVGYNWMLSNEVSADHLDQEILRFRSELAAEAELAPEQVKVIVITHSMGGYVARYAATQLFSPMDLVIHGAMPTHGSPATYANAHRGYDGAAGIFLGINGAEVSAVLGFCQGGLELLPNQYYQTVDKQKDWLSVKSEAGAEISITEQYPGEKIFDFYMNSKLWYSFVETRLLASESNSPDTYKYYIEKYVGRVEKVKKFHQNLSENFHPKTLLMYNHDIGIKFKSYDRIHWQCKHFLKGDVKSWQVVDDDYQDIFAASGKLKLASEQTGKQYHKEMVYYRHRSSLGGDEKAHTPHVDSVSFNIAQPDAPGDGTVHRGAGSNILSENIIQHHPIALTDELTLKTWGYYDTDDPQDHQLFFNSETVRTHVKQTITDFVSESFNHDHGQAEFI